MSSSTMTKKAKKRLIVVGASIGLMAILGAVAWALWMGNKHLFAAPYQPQYFTSPPISDALSSEAREACMAAGMTIDEIVDDVDACLTQYWTVDRLKRSERTRIDWYAENGIKLECYDPGWVTPPGDDDGFCEYGGTPRPHLPADNDLWWAQQATRDPGRTTWPGLDEEFVDLIRDQENQVLVS